MSFIAQIIIMIGNCESFREGKMAHAPNRSEWKWFHWVSQVWAVWLCVVHENCRQFADCCRKDRLQLRNYYFNTVHALLRFHCLEWIRIAYPTWIIKRYSSSRFAICIAPTVLTPRHAQTMTFSTSESGTLCTRSNIWVPANALYSSNIASVVFCHSEILPDGKIGAHGVCLRCDAAMPRKKNKWSASLSLVQLAHGSGRYIVRWGKFCSETCRKYMLFFQLAAMAVLTMQTKCQEYDQNDEQVMVVSYLRLPKVKWLRIVYIAVSASNCNLIIKWNELALNEIYW